MMKEKLKKNKREWIKTAAIIFLSIMLVLTFFSNTIMNYSLPQVATEYVMNDSITAKIRGTGIVKASDPFEVKATETRVVTSVKVKKGDEVQKGDILFELEQKDPEELKTAKAALEEMELAYSTEILSSQITQATVGKIESGNASSLATMQGQIAAAKGTQESADKKVKDAQAKVDSLNQQIKEIALVDTSTEEAAVSNAQSTYAQAQREEEQAKDACDKATALYEEAMSNYTKVIEANNNYNEAKKAYDAAVQNQNSLSSTATEIEKEAAAKAVQEAETKLKEALTALDQISNKDVEQAKKAVSDAESNKKNAAIAYENAQTKTKDCNYALTVAQNNLANKKDNADVNAKKQELEKQLIAAEAELAQATSAQTEAKEKLDQIQTNLKGELSIDSQYEKILEKREEVAELEEKAKLSAIEAPVSGIISDVTIVAGESMTPDTTLTTILPNGKEKTLTISVTNEQARKVNVGAIGEVADSWYFTDVTLKLISIKVDPDNPTANKKLTFTVEGEVEDGQNLNISVGDKSSTYDYVVPNSAIREDKNGKFILVVRSKSSPLGNRYFANRVDIEVLASDDKKTAIKGDVETYDYVITTASKPVEAGNQVRLYD